MDNKQIISMLEQIPAILDEYFLDSKRANRETKKQIKSMIKALQNGYKPNKKEINALLTWFN